MAGTAAPVPDRSSDQAAGASSGDDAEPAAGGNRAVAPQERRRAAIALVQVWQDVARDLALVGLGEAARIRDLGLLDELQAAAAAMGPERRRHPGAFLADLQRAAELLEGNVSPELVIDVLVLRWRSPAAGPSEEAMAGRVLATGLP
jgi:hypothetical protein